MKGDDLVVVAVHDEGGDVHFFEVVVEVGFREGLDAVVLALDAASHALIPEVFADAFRDFGAGSVVSEEWQREILPELGAVAGGAGSDAVKDREGKAAGILVGLEHDGRYRTDEDGFCNALRTVAADVASDLAASGGVADHDSLLEVEVFEESGEGVGVGIHLVAVPGLGGTAVAAAVVG